MSLLSKSIILQGSENRRRSGAAGKRFVAVAIAFIVQCCLLLILPCSASLQAQEKASPARLLIVTSQQTETYLRFVGVIDSQVDSKGAQALKTRVISHAALEKRGSDKLKQDYDVIISIGKQAAVSLGEIQPLLPILYTLIPRDTYEGLKQSGDLACAGQCTALYIDQPFERQIKVIRAAFSGIERLAVLFGPTSKVYLPAIQRELEKQKIQLVPGFVENQDDILVALDNVLKQADVLLSIPDPLIYNSRMAQSVLLKTYSYKVPFVATSKPYLNAGAMLVVYSTPEQFARQTISMIMPFLKGKTRVLPASQYPDQYYIDINPYVADSLGLALESNQKLQSMMEQSRHD